MKDSLELVDSNKISRVIKNDQINVVDEQTQSDSDKSSSTSQTILIKTNYTIPNWQKLPLEWTMIVNEWIIKSINIESWWNEIIGTFAEGVKNKVVWKELKWL